MCLCAWVAFCGTRTVSLQEYSLQQNFGSLIYFYLCTASRLLPFLHRLHSARQKTVTRQRSMTLASLVATCAPGRILSFAYFLILHMTRMRFSSAYFSREAMTWRASPEVEVNCPCDFTRARIYFASLIHFYLCTASRLGAFACELLRSRGVTRRHALLVDNCSRADY